MKKVYSCLVVLTILLTACVSAESETLKKARAHQVDMLKAAQIIDSLIQINHSNIDLQLSEMSQDTTLSSDSTKLASYMQLRESSSFFADLQNQLADWRLKTKLLPDHGIEASAFPEGTTDAEVLSSIESAEKSLNEIKLRFEAGR
jgi:hypothetical protein